jgi:hypothetical protein
MPQVNFLKLHNEASVVELAKSGALSSNQMSEVVMGHAKLAKRDNESVHQAYSRIVNSNVDIRRALFKTTSLYDLEEDDPPGGPNPKVNTMDTDPRVVAGKDALAVNNPTEAMRQPNELAAKQHRTFAEVFADPSNVTLARATYTSAHRSSVNTDYLEQ